MDIKKKIEEVVEKLSKDPQLLENFKKDPKEAVKKVLGVVLTEDVLEAIVEGVKAKIKMDKIGDALGGLGKLFGK